MMCSPFASANIWSSIAPFSTSVADQGHAQVQGLEDDLLEPAVLGEQRRFEAKFAEALRVPVDQGLNPELLGEAPQLAERRGALVQVHEVRLDAPLREKPERGPRVGALSDAEDLDLHSATGGEPDRTQVHQPLERLAQLGHR